jgi:hypothetical protein
MAAQIVMLTNCTGKNEDSSYSKAETNSLWNEITELINKSFTLPMCTVGNGKMV